MSDTIWVRRKSKVGTEDSGDDVDHSIFCKCSDELDDLAKSLGTRNLSDFFDTTDYQANLSDDDLPDTWIADNEQWFAPADAVPALEKIIERLQTGEVKGLKEKYRADLIEELEDCLVKVSAALTDGDQFHFCIVM